MKAKRKTVVESARKAVIKIGSGVIASLYERSPEDPFRGLSEEIASLREKGIKIVIVSSGAILKGTDRLGLVERPKEIAGKQAAAAIGQPLLMSAYDKAFSRLGIKTAQLLLTHEDISERSRYLNAKHTLETLLKLGCIPVVNENDTVAVEEIMFGDNDRLAALITNLTGADILVILTDTEGIYDSDPMIDGKATKLPLIEEFTAEIEELRKGGRSATGAGGISAKIEAARMAAYFGVPTLIANGTVNNVLTQIFSGSDLGTLFMPKLKKLKSRKGWIAFTRKPKGTLIIDEGAREAIAHKGRSMLPSGILDVKGKFGSGDSVRIADRAGEEFARGLVSYSSEEIRKIKGAKSKEIEAILGYYISDEVIHRNDLVILKH